VLEKWSIRPITRTPASLPALEACLPNGVAAGPPTDSTYAPSLRCAGARSLQLYVPSRRPEFLQTRRGRASGDAVPSSSTGRGPSVLRCSIGLRRDAVRIAAPALGSHTAATPLESENRMPRDGEGRTLCDLASTFHVKRATYSECTLSALRLPHKSHPRMLRPAPAVMAELVAGADPDTSPKR
jgi:hypothetical protein